jgi:hypothetical protein
VKKKLKRMFNLKRTGVRLPKITRATLVLGSLVIMYYTLTVLTGVTV